MKKKIAAFANGWSDDYLKISLQGIIKCAEDNNTDIYLFTDYASYGQDSENIQGEINILNLPRLEDFDGVLLMGNTLNNAGELQILSQKVKQLGIPTVCLEYEVEGIDCICTDNYSGMRELCEHVIGEHKVKDILFVSGIADNMENIERKKALTDVMEEHGLTLDDEHILYAEWSYYTIQGALPDWLLTHKLPEAIICANDTMAMGAILALENLGYMVPEDVIVTGFDNIESAHSINPVLTTVDRGWNERSYQGMTHLLDLINGSEPFGIRKFDSKLACGESCRCELPRNSKIRHTNGKNQTLTVPIERTLFDWHLTGIDEAAVSGNSLETTHDSFADFFRSSEFLYEGDTFCICLDDRYAESYNKPCEPRRLGYGSSVYVLYGVREGQTLPFQKIKTSYIFPVFEKPGEKANIYLIAPIHNLSTCMGYVVFKNKCGMLDTYFLYSWLRHLRSGLIRSKQSIQLETMNRKLNELSVTDELSGLLNRKGYEQIAIPHLESIKAENKVGVMMMVDINKMKDINDRYGHLQGDLAIRVVAKAIKTVIPNGWYGIRYGGDEFVVLGEKVFVDDGKMLEDQLCSAVKMEAETMLLPFNLSVSVGTVIINPEENISLDEFFRVADNKMYEMKKIAHEKAGKN